MIREHLPSSRVTHEQVLSQHRKNDLLDEAIRLKQRSIERIRQQLPQSRREVIVQNTSYFKQFNNSRNQPPSSPSPIKSASRLNFSQPAPVSFLVNHNQQNSIVTILRNQLKFASGDLIPYDRLVQIKIVNKQTIQIKQTGKDNILTFNSGQQSSDFILKFHLSYRKNKVGANPFQGEFRRPEINPQISHNMIIGQFLKKGVQCLRYKNYLLSNTQPKKLYVTEDWSSVYLSSPKQNKILDTLIKKERTNEIFRKEDAKKSGMSSQQFQELAEKSLQIIGPRIFALEFKTREQSEMVYTYLVTYQKLNKVII